MPGEYEDRLTDYRRWVSDGRPEVVVQGKPGPGAWDHPWVVYRVRTMIGPDSTGGRYGAQMDSRDGAQLDCAQQDSAAVGGGPTTGVTLTTMHSRGLNGPVGVLPINSDGGSEGSSGALSTGLIAPPAPAITTAVLVQLSTTLPPPATAPSGCPMEHALLEMGTLDGAQQDYAQPVYAAAVSGTLSGSDHDPDEVMMGSRVPTGPWHRGSKRLHSPEDEGGIPSSKKCRFGSHLGTGVPTGASEGSSHSTERSNTTTTTSNGADRAAHTATPGSAT